VGQGSQNKPTHSLTYDTEISKKDLDDLGLFGSMLGHIGDGNFHETILFDGDEEREKVAKCVHDMVHRAIEMDGTCTVSAA
jgi:D-lactate dehydrogenase (cytochrome)